MDTTAVLTVPTFEIVPTTNGFGYLVVRDGIPLVDAYGNTRTFATRNSARKRIARERAGDFHR